MGRLPGFDYKRPFFYMVTLKRTAGGGSAKPQFSKLEKDGALADTALTPALRAVVEHFHETWWCIERIRYYVIMPDHLHLIIKILDVKGRVSLAVVVRQLLKALERAAGGVSAELGIAEAAPAAHLTASALRQAAARIGPGGAGLSTFLSPLEKEAGNEIIKAGGALIVLSMQGFAERWHPTEKQERLCAAGRMLYLSPYEPQAAKLSKKEMYIRAHALVDWALEHSHYHLEAWP